MTDQACPLIQDFTARSHQDPNTIDLTRAISASPTSEDLEIHDYFVADHYVRGIRDDGEAYSENREVLVRILGSEDFRGARAKTLKGLQGKRFAKGVQEFLQSQGDDVTVFYDKRNDQLYFYPDASKEEITQLFQMRSNGVPLSKWVSIFGLERCQSIYARQALAEASFAEHQFEVGGQIFTKADIQEQIVYDEGLTASASPGEKWVGKQFPTDLSITSLDGERTHFQFDQNKEYTLISLWGTWCGPCIEEMADFYEYESAEDVPFTHTYMSVNEPLTKVKGFVERHGYPTQDFVSVSSEVASQLRIKTYPSNILINRNGEIVFASEGKVEPEKIIERIQSTEEQ